MDVVIHHVILIMPDNVVLQANLVLLFVLFLLELLVFPRCLGLARHLGLGLGPLECPGYLGQCFERYLLDIFKLLEQWGFPEW